MNYLLFMPEFTLTALAFGVLGIDLFLPREKKGYLPWLSLVGLAGVLALSLRYLWGKETNLYDGLFLIDNFSLFFKGFFLVLGPWWCCPRSSTSESTWIILESTTASFSSPSWP